MYVRQTLDPVQAKNDATMRMLDNYRGQLHHAGLWIISMSRDSRPLAVPSADAWQQLLYLLSEGRPQIGSLPRATTVAHASQIIEMNV
jgi:hypothetical protein